MIRCWWGTEEVLYALEMLTRYTCNSIHTKYNVSKYMLDSERSENRVFNDEHSSHSSCCQSRNEVMFLVKKRMVVSLWHQQWCISKVWLKKERKKDEKGQKLHKADTSWVDFTGIFKQ